MLEVVVIGAGIAGFAVALSLWERGGGAVTVVDSGPAGGGATGASAGMLAAQYESAGQPARFRLCLKGRARFPAFAARLQALSGRDLGVRWPGLLVANFTREEHAAAEATVREHRAAGLRAEVLGSEEARRIEPQLSDRALSYIWLPDEGQVDTQALAAAIGPALASTDVRLITGAPVEAVVTEEGRVVGVSLADGRTLSAERVVLAAGAWSGTIAGPPRAVPVRPVRGQLLRYAAGALELGHIVGSHAGRYLVPRADGTVLAGSTMEEVGFDRAISEEASRAIQLSVRELVPVLSELRPSEHWSGLRPLSADGLPVLGPEPELEGLFYATGYGRDGILVAPLAGSVVADLVLSGRSDFDWSPFRPDRFGRR